jgi:hypothetical protein
MRAAILAALLAVPGYCGAASYTLKDKGDFEPTGRRVEFADRYGWQSYEARFDFELDEGGRSLTRGSKLTIRIKRRDGGDWSYKCKAKGSDAMTANVNFVPGRGLSIVAECRIPERDFAKAVDLHADDVGRPVLVFQAIVQDGQVKAGSQRGVYFLPGGQIESSDLNAYASSSLDGLAVVFRSAN